MSISLLHRIPQVALFLETAIKTNRDFLSGILRYVRINTPWGIHLFEDRRGEMKISMLPRYSINGILGTSANPELNLILSSHSIPAVIFDTGDLTELPPFFHRTSLVKCDSSAVGRMAAEYLQERGFPHFAFVGEIFRKQWSEDRRIAFEEVLAANGRTCHSYQCSDIEAGDIIGEQKRLIRWLKGLPKPIGIFAAMDVRARQVADACRRANINVPHEAGVLGVDNDHLLCEACCPPVSSILMNSEEVGFKAAELLDQLMKREFRGKTTLFYGPMAVISRQSTDSRLCCDPLISKALEFIWINSGKSMGVKEIENYLDVSRRSLEIRFRNTTGRTVLQELV